MGYTMKIIAPAGSKIKSAEDLTPSTGTRPRVTFTSPDSNSGFKAALVMLMEQRELFPERDYDWGFSLGHDTSINTIVAKEADLAPVASDVLEGMIAQGKVAKDAFVTVYESERFPPAVLGYACNLKPELRTAIREALLAFDWTGTSVANEYATAGNAKLVPVNYKDDWANTRRIDDIVRRAHDENRAAINSRSSTNVNGADLKLGRGWVGGRTGWGNLVAKPRAAALHALKLLPSGKKKLEKRPR